jgi:hypothetical protein
MNIQIGHILIYRRQHSSLPDVLLYFRRANCDKYHCLPAAKGRERLAVSKRATHVFYMEKFLLKKLKVKKKSMGLNLKKIRSIRKLKLCYEHQQNLGKLLEYNNCSQTECRLLRTEAA